LFAAIRANDTALLDQHIVDVLTEAGKGLSETAYRASVKVFAAKAIHPGLNMPLGRTFFLPMTELVQYLKAKGFRVYVVSGSSQSFVQAFAASATGLPLDQIIGTLELLSYSNGDFILTGKFDNLAVAGVGKPEVMEYRRWNQELK
jgi:phosphoserine phosphatase